jgi:hypothetical protein
MPEPNFMKLGMYIMTPEPIAMTNFINPSHQSVCLYLYPFLIVARQRLGKQVPVATNTWNKEEMLDKSFFMRSVSCLWVSLCISLSLQDNGSVKIFPRQQRIVGVIIFCAVRVVSKERRRLVLPVTFCSLF